jgi:glycine cleavage system H lipoate-binding protein
MGSYQYVDIFATKGIEYLFVIGFLLTLVVFWRYLNRSTVLPNAAATARLIPTTPWFRMADGLYFHQGHSWARVEDNGTVVVGMDDFAQKLVGEMNTIQLPKPGETVRQGTKAWDLVIDSRSLPMRSPVSGQVVEVNDEVLSSPRVVNADPYERGWLLKVRPKGFKDDVTNLLSGDLARAWMEQTSNMLRTWSSGSLGVVLQDGGLPVQGIARNMSQEKWHEIASEFLLHTPSE